MEGERYHVGTAGGRVPPPGQQLRPLPPSTYRQLARVDVATGSCNKAILGSLVIGMAIVATDGVDPKNGRQQLFGLSPSGGGGWECGVERAKSATCAVCTSRQPPPCASPCADSCWLYARLSCIPARVEGEKRYTDFGLGQMWKSAF